MNIRFSHGLRVIVLALLPWTASAQDDAYTDIPADLQGGVLLEEVSARAYDNAEAYWEVNHGHARDGHDHPADTTTQHDGADEELSAGEAVTAIYTTANGLAGKADPNALDIVKVTVAVIDAWPECEDTFDAVRAAVTLQPDRADEIVATVAYKRNCNCSNGGLWLDQRVEDRLRVEMRFAILDAPFQCSCSQVAMYAGIAGLPENRAWNENLTEAQKQALIRSMTERVTVITERTAAMQNHNGWDCGCTDINIAASMQGISEGELRDATYDGLAQKYADEAGDTGLVVDAFGMVDLYPGVHWGEGQTSAENNDLRRKGQVFRGDNLLFDPFDPSTEYTGHGDRNFENLGVHQVTSVNTPTDIFISEYLEGWNDAALQQPENQRDPETGRNRVVELYNGSAETIDLGNGQYLLEIWGEPGPATQAVAAPPALVKRTISLGSDVTFEFDKADIRPEASADLNKIVQALNQEELFSEIIIAGYTCDLGAEDYNLGLSERRADSVRNYLQQAGLKDVEVRTEGFGEANPRVPNTSAANRSLNRRVEITFVTRQGEDVQTTVSEAGPGAPKTYEYTFMQPQPASVQSVESAQAGTMAAGEYSKGEGNGPRQVIGLNGAIEPGKTFIVAYSESDDVIKDKAQEVTNQLNFRPNETLVIRRLGGEMALSCRAQAYSYVTNYPPVPFIRYPDPSPTPPPQDGEVASPN